MTPPPDRSEVGKELREIAESFYDDPNTRENATLHAAADELDQLSALRDRAARMEQAARAVLYAASKDVGIAKLSEDGLHWLCPECESAGDCKPDCTRNALFGALDALDAAARHSLAHPEKEKDDAE